MHTYLSIFRGAVAAVDQMAKLLISTGSECIKRFYETRKAREGAGKVLDHLCRMGIWVVLVKKVQGKKLRFQIPCK